MSIKNVFRRVAEIGPLKNLKGVIRSYLVPQKWVFPAREFEQQTGMTGLSRSYKTPKGQDETDLASQWYEIYGRRKYGVIFDQNISYVARYFNNLAHGIRESEDWEDELRTTVAELIRLNPELSIVRYNPDDIEQTFRVLDGALSGFNPDDINYYVNEWEQADRNYSNAYKDLLEEHLPANIYWIASPATLQKIKSHFGLEKWEPEELAFHALIEQKKLPQRPSPLHFVVSRGLSVIDRFVEKFSKIAELNNDIN